MARPKAAQRKHRGRPRKEEAQATKVNNSPMATQKPANKPSGTQTAAQGTSGELSRQDIQFLNNLRAWGPQIVTSLLGSASECGQNHDWQGMNEYRSIADTLSTHLGVGTQIATPQVRAMSATAGR